MVESILWHPAAAERIAEFLSPTELHAITRSSASISRLLGCYHGRAIAGCSALSNRVQGSVFPAFECIDRCVVASSSGLQLEWPVIEAIEMEWPSARCLFLEHSLTTGWGVYAKVPIPRNTAICAYVGEVIRTSELSQRRKTYDEQGLNYVLTAREIAMVGSMTSWLCSGLSRRHHAEHLILRCCG